MFAKLAEGLYSQGWLDIDGGWSPGCTEVDGPLAARRLMVDWLAGVDSHLEGWRLLVAW
jgi:hypothetical protein